MMCVGAEIHIAKGVSGFFFFFCQEHSDFRTRHRCVPHVRTARYSVHIVGLRSYYETATIATSQSRANRFHDPHLSRPFILPISPNIFPLVLSVPSPILLISNQLAQVFCQHLKTILLQFQCSSNCEVDGSSAMANDSSMPCINTYCAVSTTSALLSRAVE